MKNVKKIGLTDLLLIKQWLNTVNGAGTIKHVRTVADCIINVDKELWCRIIGYESPWESAKYYNPNNLEEKEDVNEQQSRKTSNRDSSKKNRPV